MNKKEQLKKSLQKLGIDLDQFSGDEKLTSKLLERIRGGEVQNSLHDRTSHVRTHERVIHSREHERAITC